MADQILKIGGAELKKLIAEGKTIVCDFFATWCGPCRMLSPVLEKLAGEFSDRAAFVKVDIDENTEVAIENNVMSIPDVYIFSGGKVVNHNLGYLPEEEMRQFLDENL